MPADRQIYLLDPQQLPPETIAVAFAKTSRSPQSFREIAAELSDEKSAEFHEKWVVGYGHASVAEHAVLHVAIENVSRLAVEAIESNRLASYTEKSTRYQKWSPDEYYVPAELADQPRLLELYHDTCARLFAAYQTALPAVRAVVLREDPPRPGESEAAWDRRMRSEYVDVCRFLLPAASLANLGMTINARGLEHALCKMLSHPLEEVRQAGKEIQQVASASVPTLLKYVAPAPYQVEARDALRASARRLLDGGIFPAREWCALVEYDPEGENRVLAAALYANGGAPYSEALATVHVMRDVERQALARQILGGLGRHDTPLRELEHTRFTFDVTLDQGAYFELKRHRMMTQTPQALTTSLGYATPRRIAAAGLEGLYREAMQAAHTAWQELAQFNPDVAGYVTPNGYLRRVLLTFNLRTAFHFIPLRAAPNAHFSIRRLARRMGEQIQEASPLLGAFLPLDSTETWRSVEENYFI